MYDKKDYLIQVLERHQLRHQAGSLPVLSWGKLQKSTFYDEAVKTYKALGGTEAALPFPPRQYDIELRDCAIILDEAPAFHRYRGQTLTSGSYAAMAGFPLENYKRFCRQFEPECLKSASFAGRWTGAAAEKHFGPSDENGELGKRGAAQWKMNAYADFLADLAYPVLQIPVYRVSVYDNLMINGKLTRLNQLLMSRNAANEAYLFKYLARITGKNSTGPSPV